MKILIQHDGSLAHYYIRMGKARAFSALGHDVIIWDIRQKSAFDAFDSFEPDILLGQSYNINESVIECIKQRPALKVMCKVGDWGYKTEEISKKFTMLSATQKEKDLLLDLKRQTGQPEFGVVHHHKDWLDDTHGYWNDNGIRVLSMLNAADIFEYTNGQYKEKYACDINYIGGYWPTKALTVDKYFLPLCKDFKYKIKIFGNQHWPCPQYLGYIADHEVKHAMKSATINLCFSEPHSGEFGYDITEKPFKILSNKCLCIADYVEGINKLFDDSIVLCKTPEEMWAKIDYFLTKPKEMKEIIESGYKKVLAYHTYIDRVFQIFYALNLMDECHKVIAKKREILQMLGL